MATELELDPALARFYAELIEQAAPSEDDAWLLKQVAILGRLDHERRLLQEAEQDGMTSAAEACRSRIDHLTRLLDGRPTGEWEGGSTW